MHCLSPPRQNILHSPNLLYHPFQLFQSQDLACVLIVLYAAVEQFGAPQCRITDNGGVLRAMQLLAICAEVFGQETSKLRTPEQLHRIFYATRFLR
jgi:hypothetical protein